MNHFFFMYLRDEIDVFENYKQHLKVKKPGRSTSQKDEHVGEALVFVVIGESV